MLQGTKKQIPPITQSVNPAGPPAAAFESLVMKKRMSTNKNVKSRVVSKPGNARSAYDSDASALSDGRSPERSSESLTDDREDILVPPWLSFQEAKSLVQLLSILSGRERSSRSTGGCIR